MGYHAPAPLLAAILAATVSTSGCSGCLVGVDAGSDRTAPTATATPTSAAPAATAPAAAAAATVPAEASAPAPASASSLPEAAAPFPGGLSGTLVFQSDRTGRTKIYSLDLAAGKVTALTT